MIIFHHAVLPVNHNFAAGLIDPPAIHAPLVPGARKAQYSATDAAWKAGFDAAMASDFEDVYPPESMTSAEMRAFAEGAREGYRALEFNDPSDPADWDRLAEEHEAMASYESGGYWHC